MKVLQALALAGIGTELTKLSAPKGAPGTRELLEAIGARYSIDPDILHAIAWQESNVRQIGRDGELVRGRDGEVGMMQVLPDEVRRDKEIETIGYRASQLEDIQTNVIAAAELWFTNRARAGNSIADLLSAYNAGLRSDGSVKRDRDGGYVNDRYVTETFLKFVFLKVGSSAPSSLVRSLAS